MEKRNERSRLRAKGVLALGPESQLAGLLARLQGLLLGRQLTALGTGELGAQVDGLPRLAAVHPSEVLLLRLVDHRQHAGDVLSEDADLGELRGGAAGHLGDAQVGQLLLQLLQLLQQIVLLLAAQILHLQLGHFRLICGR